MFDPAAPTTQHVADYALVWPREVFRAEAREHARRADGSPQWRAEAGWLLEDAFAGEVPARDLTTVSSGEILTARQRWRPAPADRAETLAQAVQDFGALSGDPPRQYLQYLAEVTEWLPLAQPGPYWAERPGAEPATAVAAGTVTAGAVAGMDGPEDDRLSRVQVRWAALIEELQFKGYLAQVAPSRCVREEQEPPPEYWLNRATADRLGVAAGSWWPLQPGTWSREEFFNLVEVVHDLVARPRMRERHRHKGLPPCGWHFADFSLQVGRSVYRWQVNQLLGRHGLDLRLADDGEDTGRLVRVSTDDGHDELMHQVLTSTDTSTDTTTRAAVRHAIALFRGRAATRETKRDAIFNLGRVLEHRRKLLERELLRKDEGALFEIANRFDLRHRKADQHPEYDEAYLDWIFRWYLATVQLTEDLLARQAAPPGPATNPAPSPAGPAVVAGGAASTVLLGPSPVQG